MSVDCTVHLYHNLSPTLKDHHGQGCAKTVRATDQGRLEQKVSSGGYMPAALKNTAAVIGMRSKESTFLHREREEVHESPSKKGESVFFNSVVPYSRMVPHADVYDHKLGSMSYF